MERGSLILSLFLISILVISGCGTNKYDTFAKCLTEEGVKMYGAYWCPHCANQKDLFGNSFQYVDYIECSLPNRGGQTQVCIDEEIKTYPIWEFADGERTEGVMALEQISKKSNCELEGIK